MGREKRIAESRTKEILDRSKPSETSRADAPASTPAVAAVPAAYMSTGRALWHILLLFLIPAILLVLAGKFIFRL